MKREPVVCYLFITIITGRYLNFVKNTDVFTKKWQNARFFGDNGKNIYLTISIDGSSERSG